EEDKLYKLTKIRCFAFVSVTPHSLSLATTALFPQLFSRGFFSALLCMLVEVFLRVEPHLGEAGCCVALVCVNNKDKKLAVLLAASESTGTKGYHLGKDTTEYSEKH
ncbi:hypothetical protein GOODEAATRI_003299, partial [Goodea atripinnis]